MKQLDIASLENLAGGFCDPNIPGICVNTCILYYLADSAFYIYNNQSAGFPPNYCNN
jgi:hypothetical protein